MKTPINKRPVIVGIFILLGLAILIITIFTLGGQKKTFVKSITIHAVFNDVSGLLTGGNIWFSGVKVGTVKKISFYGQSQVLVTMSIEKMAEAHIHKGAKARIGSDGLIGNKIIIIYGGEANAPQVGKEEFLLVEKSFSTDDMIATLQANNENILAITAAFKSISKKIDSGKGTLSILLNNGAMANKLNHTVTNLEVTVDNFKTAAVTSKNIAADLRLITTHLNDPGNSIHNMVTDTLLYNNMLAILQQLQTAAYGVSRFATNLETASNQLNQQHTIAGTLLNDSAAASSLKATFKNLETSSQKLDEDLEALQHNFLLRGFFKKREKAKLP